MELLFGVDPTTLLIDRILGVSVAVFLMAIAGWG